MNNAYMKIPLPVLCIRELKRFVKNAGEGKPVDGQRRFIISELWAGQSTVRKSTVQRYRRTGTNGVIIGLFGRKKVIMDGHHRVAAAMLNGQEVILCWYAQVKK